MHDDVGRDVRRRRLPGHVRLPPGHLRVLRRSVYPRGQFQRLPELPDGRAGVHALRVSPPIDPPAETPMRSKSNRRLLVRLAAVGFVWGCGGQTETKGDGGAQQDGPAPTSSVLSGSPDSATTGPMSTANAAPPTAGDGASTACTPMGAGGGGGNGSCTSTFGEMCGGTSYQVSCECPRGSCVCFGTSTTVVPFSGCPSCPGLPNIGPTTDDLLALCGFPH